MLKLFKVLSTATIASVPLVSVVACGKTPEAPTYPPEEPTTPPDAPAAPPADIDINGDDLFKNVNIDFAGFENNGFINSLPPSVPGVIWSYKLNGTNVAGVPNGLSTGDKVIVKANAENGYKITGQIESDPFTVSGLTAVVGGVDYDAQDLLSKATVSFSGDNGKASLTISSLTKVLAFEYSTNGGSTFSENKPTGLSNGDNVTIRIVDNGLGPDDELINKDATRTWTVANLTVPGQVFDGQGIMDARVVSFSGENGSGVINISDLPNNLQFLYRLNSGSYSKIPPSNLSNGDKIYLQLGIIDPSNGDTIDHIPTALNTVSGLTDAPVAPPVDPNFAPIDRNSAIKNNGASTYSVQLSSAVGIGTDIETTQYETDMFVYEIDDDLILNGAPVPYSDVENFIRAVEHNTQFGPGMYVNWHSHNFNNIGKTTIPILALQNGLSASTSVANSSGIEVVIGTGFNRDLDFFAATTIHELAHKDGQVTTGAMIENFNSAFVPNGIHSKYRDTMKNHSTLSKYTTHFDSSQKGLTDRVDTTAPISTPWGTMPTGTNIWAPNVSPYIFNGNEMIARTVELMGTNFDKTDYLTDVSQLFRTVGAMDAEFGGAMYNVESEADAYADILLEDIYAFDHYGGHTQMMAHTYSGVEVEYVLFEMQFNTNYQPYEQHIADALGDALNNGRDYAIAGQPFGVYFEDLIARPTSMRFNTDFTNTVFEKDHVGKLWSVDETKLDTQRAGMVEFFEWVVTVQPHQLDWYSMEFYDSNHKVIADWTSNELY